MEMTGRSDLERQRSRAVKTAVVLGIVAALIFAAFILSGVLKS
jgi:hypothetical protein